MKLPCGSCAGTSVITPVDTTNRPGLSALSYRVGSYGSFFETMKARLSSADLRLPSGASPLRALKTRDESDPAIALLDAWAVLGDVLTFYQERIANEGYLRTATERRSVLELARLVGYALRPGVAASTYLAYTLEASGETSISAGSKAQSLPGSGELPQTFETTEDFAASGAFSNLAPRLTRPQILSGGDSPIYVAGVTNNLSPNDALLLIASPPTPYRIATAVLDSPHSRTQITLRPMDGSAASMGASTGTAVIAARTAAQPDTIESLVAPLAKSPAAHPATPLDLQRRLSDVFQPELDTAAKLVRALHPEAGDSLYTALAHAVVTPSPMAQLYAFRVQAPVYGHNAPPKPITDNKGIVIGREEWPLAGSLSIYISIAGRNQRFSAEEMSSAAILKQTAHNQEFAPFISITQGSVSASASVLPGVKYVGKWEVDVSANADTPEITFKFPQLDRLYNISANDQDVVTVKTDGPVLSVVPGQQATADQAGRHILASLQSGFLLSDDSPLVPDPLNVISLDSVYDKIVPGSWVVVVRTDTGVTLSTAVKSVAQLSLNTYGIPARVTQLTLADPWLNPATDRMLSVARNTTVYAQSEMLQLAEEPMGEDVAGDVLELGALYSDLEPGRWIIVAGERTDIPGTSGIMASELVMLAAVKQGVQQIATTASIAGALNSVAASGAPVAPQDLPGDSTHSFLQLASPLAYRYKRETVKVFGNVVQATHGETRKEVLGSGDSSQALQQFTLKASPLTFVSASSPSGVASTLAVYVNGIQWHETDSLSGSGPSDRVFVTQVDDRDKVTLTFGDGKHGMLLPTGAENVQAVYRTGIGSGGNMVNSKISLLATKPLGVRSVTNPIPATGGADRDGIDAARRNAPLASIALDRLVSVADYADFARTFAGVGKATSAQISDGHRQLVAVSIAGAEGSAIDPTSQLVQQLLDAFAHLGDPYLPVQVLIAKVLMLVVSARCKLLPDYQWRAVAPLVRAQLLTRFSFDHQTSGEPVYLSTVVGAIQQVPGVAYVVVDGFGTISIADVATADALKAKFVELATATSVTSSIPVRLEHIDPKTRKIEPAEIAYLNPNIPDTLLLTEITA